MRRLILFLVLLAFGLGLLLWLTRREREAAQKRAEEQVQAPAAPEHFAELPGEKGQGGTGLHLDGALKIIQRAGSGGTLRTEYELAASDVDFQEGDTYDLHDVVLKLFDPLSGRERAQLDSPLTRLKLPVVGGKPALAPDEPVRFTNVVLVLEEGAPIVPLTLRMPLLEWTPSTGALNSNDRVALTGAGLTAEGSGLEASIARADLRLLRDGSIELELENGAQATLRETGSGAFEILRVDPPEPQPGETRAAAAIEVHVHQGAQLSLSGSGREPVTISAGELVLRGVQRQSGAKAFVLLDAEAHGNVHAESRGDTFDADNAHWNFDAAGRLERATLDGAVALGSTLGTFHARSAEFHFEPDGSLRDARLEGEPSGLVELARRAKGLPPELAGSRPRLSGAGPLVLDFSGGTHVEMGGPARLEIPETGFEIDALTRLSGNVDAEARTGRLLAEGGAHAGWRASELWSPTIDVHYALGTARGDVVGASATGATRAKLAMPEGEPLELAASAGLEARSIAGHLTIPLARGVTLERKGAEAFVARAAEVREFDHRAQTFRAEGDVHVEDARGSGSAERVLAQGPKEHVFFGTARAPARWELRERDGGTQLGTAQAVEIRVHETSLDALGSVSADIDARDGHYALGCEDLHLERVGEPGVPAAQGRAFRAHAQRNVKLGSHSALRGIDLSSDELDVTGRFRALPRSGESAEIEAGTLDARGSVVVDWSQAGELHGEGERFELDSRGHGTLSAHEGARVHTRGRLPGRTQPYQLDADWIAYGEQRLEAQHAALALVETPGGEPKPSDESSILLELSTDRLVADERSVHLDGQAHALGRTRSGQPWVIDASDLLLEGDFEKRGSVEDTLALARATGSVHVQIGEQLDLRGDKLEGQPSKLRVEGRPATLEISDSIWESPWIEYDPVNMMLSTARGSLRARDQRDKSAWSVEYESLQPFDQQDTTILVLHNPVFRQDQKELRANWALFWVDREEWRRNTQGAMRRRIRGADLRTLMPEPPPERRPSSDPKRRFQELRDDPLARILSEVYVEGEVELVEHSREDPKQSQRRARAKAFYLDLRQGMGWLQEADVVLPLPFRAHGFPENIRAKAAWMRVGSDFSLSADDAVITSCEYDEPHYMIETSRLRITPSAQGKKGWNFEARDNALRFGRGGLTIPLPTIDTPTDERGNPNFITDIFAGNSSKFGASVRATINLALGSLGFGIGRFFGGLLQVPTQDLDGHWKFDVGVLGTRGLLLGGGLEFSIPDKLRFEVDYSIIPDNQEDRGLIRVPESERSLLRQWFHLRGRRFFGPTEWVDIAYSWQSDPGVQSEFFERDYLYYEQKDTYVHWRKAEGSTFWSASAKVRGEDRTDVDELPKLGWYLGRHPVWRMGQIEVLYQAQASAGYFQRREGDSLWYPPFADGGGERDILRADTEHRLEAPFSLGFAGARATPFVSARGTAWSASSDGYEDATRGVLSAGVESSTTLWKRYSGGTLSTITPRVGVHGDVVDENGGPPPLAIDSVEDNLTGTYVDLGVRGRWWQPRTKEHLDLDLSVSHGWNVDGQNDGWRPVSVLGEFLTFVDRVPVGVTHDARYALEDPETIYSRSFLGFRPLPQWGIELGFHHGLDAAGNRLYEAATINTRYHATRKWELELSETLDLDQGRGLDHEFTLRRLGHDFVMELGVTFRAGEGTGFGIKLVPNLAYRRSGLGLIDRWLGQDE